MYVLLIVLMSNMDFTQTSYINMTFLNRYFSTVNIAFNNYNNVLEMNKTINIPCMVGDEIMFFDADQKLIMTHIASEVKIYDTLPIDTPFVDCNRPKFDGSLRWTPQDSLIFKNNLKSAVNIFYKDTGCEEWAGSIQTGHNQHIMSTLGHVFNIRMAYNNRLVMQYTFDYVTIKATQECIS